MLNVTVSEIILNEPRIRALVGQGEAASVAQHVGMGEQGQRSGLAVIPQEQIDGRGDAGDGGLRPGRNRRTVASRPARAWLPLRREA